MKKLRTTACFALAALVVLAAPVLAEEESDCTVQQTTPVTETPASRPERDGKETVLHIDQAVLNNLSAEERAWYVRFQEGVAFFDGWSSISEDILAIFPEAEVQKHKQIVQRLGVKIGTEWAKDNTIRKIDTAMLKEWGARIREAVDAGPENVAEALERIEAEVDLLLQSTDEVSLNEPQT